MEPALSVRCQLMVKKEWPYALRMVHLPGGLYAVNPPEDDEVRLYSSSPANHDNILYAFSIPTFGAVFSALYNLGLRPLGTTFFTDRRQQEGIYPPSERHFYRAHGHTSPWLLSDATQTWGQIAHHSAKDDTNIQLMDLARRISFELYACSAKWFELSNAYAAVLNGRVKDSKEFRAGERFDTLNSRLVHLAIHSLLSEMSSLRDYLAEFVAQHLLINELPGNPYTKMSTLIAALKKRPDITHPVARSILTITSDRDGWLAIISAYRDLIIHHAPASMTEGESFMLQKELQITEEVTLPYIESYLPSDPVATKKERSRGTSMQTLAEWNRAFSDPRVADGPDALRYLHNALGQLAVLSLGLADYSPVKSKPIEISAGSNFQVTSL